MDDYLMNGIQEWDIKNVKQKKIRNIKIPKEIKNIQKKNKCR